MLNLLGAAELPEEEGNAYHLLLSAGLVTQPEMGGAGRRPSSGRWTRCLLYTTISRDLR